MANFLFGRATEPTNILGLHPRLKSAKSQIKTPAPKGHLKEQRVLGTPPDVDQDKRIETDNVTDYRQQLDCTWEAARRRKQLADNLEATEQLLPEQRDRLFLA